MSRFIVEPLSGEHDLESFASGRRAADEYLSLEALGDQRGRRTRTYVACREGKVIGYYTVTVGSIEEARHAQGISGRRRRKLIPVVVIARFGVDIFETEGYVRSRMLSEVVARCRAAAGAIGARAIIVNAIDAETRSLYERHGFVGLPASRFQLVLSLPDVQTNAV